MRFEEACEGWTEKRLSQEEAASLMGVCSRTFRCYVYRYEEEGYEGLLDRRMSGVSHRRAPVDEVMQVAEQYRRDHGGWNVRHFHAWYRRAGGNRSCTWVKSTLQSEGLVEHGSKRGQHRKCREASPLPGMMIHQDGSTHEWVPGRIRDMIVTMDDATSEYCSMFFCEQERIRSSLRGVRGVIESKGLFCSLYTDRGSHYWHTSEAGGKVTGSTPPSSGVPSDRSGSR